MEIASEIRVPIKLHSQLPSIYQQMQFASGMMQCGPSDLRRPTWLATPSPKTATCRIDTPPSGPKLKRFGVSRGCLWANWTATYRHVNATKLQHFDDVVNAVRKSDWADATVGLIRFGLPQSFLGEAYKTIPEAGFHNVLLNMAPKLSPDSVVGQMEVLKILKW